MQVNQSGIPLQVIRYRRGLGDASTGFDWGSLLDKAMGTASTIYDLTQQRKIAEAQAKANLEMAKLQQQQALNWGVSLPGGADMLSLPGISTTPNWLLPVAIGGGLLLAGFFLLKD